MIKKGNNSRPEREQINSLDPKDNVDSNSQYYGDEDNRSAQIVTNYYYRPNNSR